MRTVEPARWDDLALAVLLLLISVPRSVIALAYDRPIGGEGALSMVAVVLGLVILLYRNLPRQQPPQARRSR